MRISTTRWLLAAFVIFSVVGTATAQRTVTLKLNTATLPDTLDAMDVIQVRGALDGVATPFTLPDANVIDWGDATTIRPANIGGDLWEVMFQIPDDQGMQFKFYSQLLEDDISGGWEDGDNVPIAAGTGDLDMGLHYFNKVGNRDYNWTPFESKTDSVGVLYRVFMCTVNGQGDSYNPNDSDQKIAMRGSSEQGGLDWGTSKIILEREGGTGTPGFDLYSGIVYYPVASAGMTQMYKFVTHRAGEGLDSNQIGWESLASDRAFVIPAEDTTVPWVYYGDSTPAECGVEPIQATVIFSVDLSPLEAIGLFDKSRGDSLQVRGGFNGWNCDNFDDCLLLAVPGESIFELAAPVTAIPGTEQKYKFYLDFNNAPFVAQFGVDPPNGWEEPISTTGADRGFFFDGDPAVDQFLGDKQFNDVLPGNIMPAGSDVDVTFTVDMTAAMDAGAAEPFAPETHSVFLELGGDALWAFTQGVPSGGIDETFILTNVGGNIYSGTLLVTGPTYGAIQYKYTYGTVGGGKIAEAGGSTTTQGRRRTRFIVPNQDGSWPAAFSINAETYQPEGALPFDCNPVVAGCEIAVAIEALDGEVPTQVALSQNFPNPFNPTTSIEYSLNRTSQVRMQVYDVLGRLVATLVDSVQPASSYRVSFDAAQLASGTYIYRLETPNQVITKTMLLLK